jgi:hypothetical protein
MPTARVSLLSAVLCLRRTLVLGFEKTLVHSVWDVSYGRCVGSES